MLRRYNGTPVTFTTMYMKWLNILKIERWCSFTDHFSSAKLHLLSIFNIIMFHLKPTPLSLSKIKKKLIKISYLFKMFRLVIQKQFSPDWLSSSRLSHNDSLKLMLTYSIVIVWGGLPDHFGFDEANYYHCWKRL